MQVEIGKTYRGYSDAALTKALGVVRLTKAGMAAIPYVLTPDLLNPGHRQLMWLFEHKGPGNYKAADPGYDVTIKASTKVFSHRGLLNSVDDDRADHAGLVMNKEWGKPADGGCFRPALQNTLLTYVQFIDESEGRRRRIRQAFSSKA